MKNTIAIIFILFFICQIPEYLFAKEKGKTLNTGLTVVDYTLINAGRISMWVYADGNMARNPIAYSNNTVYPRGTATIVFQDGILWAGMVHDGGDTLIRVGGQRYYAGTKPGAIISKGVAEDASDPAVNRIWRVRKRLNYYNLQKDAAELLQKPFEDVTDIDIEELRSKYVKDWLEWPWQKGAPFYDADGDGVYTPKLYSDWEFMHYPEADEPGLANADQVVWFVCNDLHAETARIVAGSPPIGLEMQGAIWAYDRNDALGHCIFKQIRFMFKGLETTPDTAVIDSMYIAQWADPELGNNGDDLAGCDTFLDLGYVYNANFSDSEFTEFNLPPPAVGYDLLAGPIISTKYSKNHYALYNLKWRQGYDNIPMTTFMYFASSYYTHSFIEFYRYIFTYQWWNIFRGFRPRPESPPQPWYNPNTGERTMYRVPGDPVTGTGWIDSYASDRRIFLGSGSFKMELGDTNEVSIGLVAGLGSDRLTSISVMKYYDKVCQNAMNNCFEIPQPPPTPHLIVTAQDAEVIVNWGSSYEETQNIEEWQQLGYHFEGYNVYQLPSQNSWNRDEWVRLATFDIENDVTIISQQEFDPATATLTYAPVQYGTNSGIKRVLHIKKDKRTSEPFVNGKTYYFAVSSYSYNSDPEVVLKSLESEPVIITVVPEALKPGVELTANIGDTLTVQHTGRSEGAVYPVVFDPIRLQDATYEVTFTEIEGGEYVWNLKDITTDSMLLIDIPYPEDESDYLYINGFFIVPTKPELFGKGYTFEGEPWVSTNPNADGELMDGAAYLGLNFWGESAVDPGDYVSVRVDFFGINNWNDDDGDGALSAGEIYEVEVGKGQLAYLYSTWGAGNFTGTATVPWKVCDIDSDPPRQLDTIIRDRDQNGQWDLNDGETILYNYAFVMDTEYDPAMTTWDPTTGGRDFMEEIFIDGGPVQWVFWWGRKKGVATTEDFSLEFYAPHINTEQDTFRFSTQAPQFDVARAREDVTKINVYPNPFYLYNFIEKGGSRQYVTFNHLPTVAHIRIFNLAGVLVRTLVKEEDSQFLTWDLLNQHSRLVASGIYIAHIDMPELGVEKILKIAIVHQ